MAPAEKDTSGFTGLYFGILQLVFALCWTTYVIYLPRLAAQVGIGAPDVVLILMLDQAIFTITDTITGIAADRVAKIVGRVGFIVGIVSALSCVAFVALPFVAGLGAQRETSGGTLALFIVIIVIWSATSSALRAPPLALLGKHRARPALPFFAGMTMLGYGIAGAASPYLGVVLRDQDPRLPFLVSGAVLLVTALSLSSVERSLARQGAVETSAPPSPAATVPIVASQPGRIATLLIGAIVILALGYQVHFSLNSVPFFLKFAKPADLEWLLPMFWIGFNLALFPASLLIKHRGGLMVMGTAGLVGALAVFGAESAGNLTVLVLAQIVAGAAWGCMLMSAISAAMAIGEGAEGRTLGLVYSALALATFARLGVVAFGLQRSPDYADLLRWAPVTLWLVAGAGLLVLAAPRSGIVAPQTK